MRNPYINPQTNPYEYHQGMTRPGMLGGGNPFSEGYTFSPGGQTGYGYGVQNTLGTNLGGILGSLGSIFGGMGNKNPYDAGMDYLNQISGTIKPYYQPYINAGLEDMGALQGQFSQLVNNPGELMKKLASGFQTSPGYDFQVKQATNASNNAAAAGGMIGSPAAQAEAANVVNNLANQDYYNYLNHVLGMYGQGIGGMQDIMHQGYGASNQLAQSLMGTLMNQANMAANQQNWQNQRQGGLWSGLGNLAGNVIDTFHLF